MTDRLDSLCPSRIPNIRLRITRGNTRRTEGRPAPHDLNEKALSLERNPRMTARRFAINALIFVVIFIVLTAVAIWLNLGPVARSAA